MFRKTTAQLQEINPKAGTVVLCVYFIAARAALS